MTPPAERWWRVVEPPEPDREAALSWKRLAVQPLPAGAERALRALADAVPPADADELAELRGVLAALRARDPRAVPRFDPRSWGPLAPSYTAPRPRTELERRERRLLRRNRPSRQL